MRAQEETPHQRNTLATETNTRTIQEAKPEQKDPQAPTQEAKHPGNKKTPQRRYLPGKIKEPNQQTKTHKPSP